MSVVRLEMSVVRLEKLQVRLEKSQMFVVRLEMSVVRYSHKSRRRVSMALFLDSKSDVPEKSSSRDV